MTFIEYHSNSHVKVNIHMLAGSRPKNTGLGKVCSLQGTRNLIKTDKRVLILKLTFHFWQDLLKATVEKTMLYFFLFFSLPPPPPYFLYLFVCHLKAANYDMTDTFLFFLSGRSCHTSHLYPHREEFIACISEYVCLAAIGQQEMSIFVLFS